MYLAGVSVRRVEDITEALWGTKVSPGTISNLNKKAYEHIETWRTRPLSGEYPYIYVDGVYLKRSWGGEIQNVSVLVAIGVNRDGCSEIIGAAEGMKEDKESWRPSLYGSKSAVYRAFVLLSVTSASVCWKPSPKYSRMPNISGARYIFTVTSFPPHPVNA